MFLVRKITRAKWDSNSELSVGEISADAVTSDLRTQRNSLSFWRCRTETNGDVEDAALAIAAARDQVDTIDIVWLDEDELRTDDQRLRNSEGRTPVTELVGLHVDVYRLDYVRLGRIARRIVTAIEEKRYRRITRARVKKLLAEAVVQGRVKLADLQTSVQTEVQKSLDPDTS